MTLFRKEAALIRPWRAEMRFLSRLFLRFMKFTADRSPERVGEGMSRSMPDADKAYIPQVQQILADTLVEAVRSGPRGAQYDAWLYQQPWDFLLQDIERPVFLWTVSGLEHPSDDGPLRR